MLIVFFNLRLGFSTGIDFLVLTMDWISGLHRFLKFLVYDLSNN